MPKKPVSFSTQLLRSVVILVTGSVVLISVVLFLYLSQRLESEFKKTIRAQKRQAETILYTRLEDIQQSVTALSTENSLQAILSRGDTWQVKTKAEGFCSRIPSVSLFVKKAGQPSIYPQVHPTLPDRILSLAKEKQLKGEIVEDKGARCLLWWFEAPVVHKDKQVGAVFALYDLMQDKELINTFRRVIQDNILIPKSNTLHGLLHEMPVPIDSEALQSLPMDSGFIRLNSDLLLTPLGGYRNLYLSSSRKVLTQEKNNIALFIVVFTLLGLAVSVLFSILLGKRLARPLSEMTNKAYQITRGVEGVSFEDVGGDYLEFQRLSQVFNAMLIQLKKMEEKTRYTELMGNVDDAVYLIDSHGKIIQANKAAHLHFGYHMKTPLAIDHDAILPKKDAKAIRSLINAHLDQSPQKITIETTHIGRGDSRVPVEIKARAIMYRGQRVILNVARDIRARKEAEQALRESKERYRSVVESSHEGILIVNQEDLIIYVNSQLCGILGYPRNEIEGKKITDYFPDMIALSEDSHNPKNIDMHSEKFAFTRKDGQKRHGSIRVTAITDGGGNKKIIIQLLDITDRLRIEREKKELESQLLHAQKMEAIGALAGGVAHDFNNLLQVIQGHTELLVVMKSENDPELKQLQEIKSASQRASELTAQLLTFGRKSEKCTIPISLSNEIAQSCRLLERALPNTIELKHYLSDDMMICVGPGQVQQVIMNLGINARDAMPDGGRLVIETKTVLIDKAAAKRYLAARPGRYARLSVTDSGYGMDAETMKHIFEPFFTTKKTGKGTGLGMAIVYGIVQDAGGYITCHSKVGVGTTFRAYFPVAEQSENVTPVAENNSSAGHASPRFK